MGFPVSVTWRDSLIIFSSTFGGSGSKTPSPGPHPALVPGLRFRFAAAGDVVILGLDISNDAVHIQHPAVVHLHNDRGLRDLRLEQADLLEGVRRTSELFENHKGRTFP